MDRREEVAALKARLCRYYDAIERVVETVQRSRKCTQGEAANYIIKRMPKWGMSDG